MKDFTQKPVISKRSNISLNQIAHHNGQTKTLKTIRKNLLKKRINYTYAPPIIHDP